MLILKYETQIVKIIQVICGHPLACLVYVEYGSTFSRIYLNSPHQWFICEFSVSFSAFFPCGSFCPPGTKDSLCELSEHIFSVHFWVFAEYFRVLPCLGC